MPSPETFDPDAPITEPDDPRYEARVIRAFVRKDRLISIPARERKRRVILRFLLDQVQPDESPVLERDLNLRIMRWNPDPSALRRFLVEANLAQRDGGAYRRAVPISGGPARTTTRTTPRTTRVRQLRARRQVRARPEPAFERPFVYSPPRTGSINP